MAFDNPHGFTLMTPINHVMVARFLVKSSETVYIGDVVKLASAAGTVEQYDDGDQIIVGVALEYGTNDGTILDEILVCIDENAQYMVQVENGGTYIERAEVGWGFDVADSPASPSGLTSTMELADEPDATGTASAPFIVIGLVKGAEPGGGTKPTWGAASQEAIVIPNRHNMHWNLDVDLA